MSVSLNPYLNFRGNARDALDFYGEVLGAEPTVTTFGEFGMEGVDADHVMHGQINAPNGMLLMASDVPESMPHTDGTSMTVCLNGDDVDGLHAIWERLIDGADVTTPLAKQMWGDEYGACVDRFGTPWMINISLSQG